MGVVLLQRKLLAHCCALSGIRRWIEESRMECLRMIGFSAPVRRRILRLIRMAEGQSVTVEITKRPSARSIVEFLSWVPGVV